MITYKTDSKASLQSSESSMPVLAMCYDFDKTLTPDDMQAQGFIQCIHFISKPSTISEGRRRNSYIQAILR